MNEREFCPVPCIVCGKRLEEAISGHYTNQPYGGLAFTSFGAYGSTVFDPMDGRYIEFNVCDECLVAAARKGAVLLTRAERPIIAPLDGFPRMVVGYEKVERPTVKWDPDDAQQRTEGEEDELHVEEGWVGTYRKGIRWIVDRVPNE